MRKSTVWIVMLDTAVGLIAGLIVIPAVFAFGVEPTAGPGLTFITLPGIFQQLTGGVILWDSLLCFVALCGADFVCLFGSAGRLPCG